VRRLPKLFGGSTWWTLSRPCLKYVVDYTKSHPDLLGRLRHSFCSEEIYFQTVIMNSPFAAQVDGNNLRYIDWRFRNGSLPAVVDETDYDCVAKPDVIFARKFQHPISATLIEELDKRYRKRCA
jgi:hypothetical protein